jgi:thioester reductase-like protein
LTGATGALGAHILHQLLHSPKVAQIYLLVRGADPWARVAASLAERGLPIPTKDLKTRIITLSISKIGEAQLGLPNTTFDILQSTTTLIIHAAWPVNFNLSLASFVPHLQSLQNLLTLSLNVPFRRPARVLFASSISTAFNLGSLAGVPGSGVSGEGDAKPRVPEAPIPSLQQAADTGYARSKLVAERICERAAAASCSSDRKEQPNVAVLRIGQIVGDTQKAIWNVREAVPLMVQSAEMVGALPLLEGGKGDCPWIPVDIVAKACLEIVDGMSGRASVNQPSRLNGPDAATNTTTASGTNGAKETNGANGSNGHRIPAAGTRMRKPLCQALYCNLMPPKIWSWNSFILPALSSPAIGLQFTPVPLPDWLDRLRTKGQELGDDAEAKLPALKLAGYFEHGFGEGGTAMGGTTGLDWETEQAYKYSRALGESGDLGFELLSRTVSNWREIWMKNV